MQTFRTKYEKHKRFHCSTGSRYETLYQEEIDEKTGKLQLVKTGKKDVYQLIQEDAEDSKMINIIHKLALKDYSVLREAKLTYVDEAEFPHSLMEAQNIVVKAKQEFENFPIEVKKLFNNSAEQYVSEIGTNEFIEKMTPYNNELAELKRKQEDEKFNAAVSEQIKFDNAVAAGKETPNESRN